MKKFFAVLGLFFSLQTQAALISVELDNVSYQKDDIISASIWMSDLSTELASFDLDLWFNSALMTFDNVTFDTYLSGPTNDSTQYANVTGNVLNFSELSFIDYLELADLQTTLDNRFHLATITFIAKKAGAFVLNFDKVELGDGWGLEIPANEFQIGNTSGTIIGVAEVPAPMTLLLLAPALLWLARRR